MRATTVPGWRLIWGCLLWAVLLISGAANAQTASTLTGLIVIDEPAPASAPRRDDADERARLIASGPIVVTVADEVFSATDAEAVLRSFLGQPVTPALTSAIVGAVNTVIEQRGRHLADVYFPPELNQAVHDGYLSLVVRPARLGRVLAQGQEFHRAADIEGQVQLQAGAPIDLTQLDNDIRNLNAGSTWRATNPTPEFRPGALPGQTDVVLMTRDVQPLRVFTNADNSGTRLTGLGRLRVGASIGNLFGRFDHQLDYTLTTASKFDRLNSHSLAYSLPLGGGDRLALRMDYTQVDVSLMGDLFRSRGSNFAASAEWLRPLARAPRSSVAQELFGGLEFKRIGSSLAFNQAPVAGTAPRVLQTYVGGRAAWTDGWGTNQVNARLTYSPGYLFQDNNDDAYGAARPGAKARYWRLNAGADKVIALPRAWAVALRLNAQLTNAHLLSSERFGLSGVGGVRGYYQDTLIADSGVTGGIELQTPQWALPGAASPAKWQLVTFMDAARSWNASDEFNADLGRSSRQFNLFSYGVGARVTLGPRAFLRVEAARRSNGLTDDHRVLWHAFVQIAY